MRRRVRRLLGVLSVQPLLPLDRLQHRSLGLVYASLACDCAADCAHNRADRHSHGCRRSAQRAQRRTGIRASRTATQAAERRHHVCSHLAPSRLQRGFGGR